MGVADELTEVQAAAVARVGLQTRLEIPDSLPKVSTTQRLSAGSRSKVLALGDGLGYFCIGSQPFVPVWNNWT
jgi:hypothetical protein